MSLHVFHHELTNLNEHNQVAQPPLVFVSRPDASLDYCVAGHR